jgi:hypothetical protein
VLCIVGRQGDPRQHGRHAGAVEKWFLRFRPAVYQPVLAALPGLIGVPEPVSGLQPVRTDSGVENKLSDLSRRPFRCQIIVGCSNRCRLGLQLERNQYRRGDKQRNDGRGTRDVNGDNLLAGMGMKTNRERIRMISVDMMSFILARIMPSALRSLVKNR